ncbi:MAG: sulfur oxidation c-type cytochrome SoxA [Rhodospirillales bacterium]|nr:sulfur oxidation c-type cytochrome SoxA [Rhodospirillales bacterium]
MGDIMKKQIQGILIGAALAVGLSGFASVVSASEMMYKAGDRHSGYTYATKGTQAMQDDDLANPANLWTDEGEALWSKVDGKAGKSCATCHGAESAMLTEVGTRYPVYNPKLGKMQSLEQRINQEREEKMGAKPYKWESKEMLSLTIFMRNGSRGKPMNVSIDGPAARFFEEGKNFYNQRRGQLDMSCKNCHVDNAGNKIRANLLSEAQSNGFPTYRLKWQKPGSIHRRFRGCNKQVRAKPYGYGSDEYVNLELYVAWRGRGLSVETPAVRN